MPHLQLVVQKRAGRSWFRRMRSISIDFQSGIGDVMTEYNAQVEMPYKMSKGPLWRARLVFPSVTCPRKDSPLDEADPTQGPQQAERYKATLIVSTQHVITDGTSNMVVCQEFLNVLNALLNQQPISLARYPFIKPITDRRVTIDAWPSVVGILLKKLKTVFIGDFTKRTSFNGLLPVPRIKQHSCRVLRHDFSEDASSKLLKLSRASNVTINSCILAAANLAMFETARKRSTKGSDPLNSAFLTSVNCVNTRRYLPADHKRVPGCHIAMQETETKVTTSDFKDVWGLAKRIHTFVQNDIEVKKSPIKLTPMYRPAALITIANHLLTKHSRKNRTDCHFTTTNMGNLKQLLPGEGSPVEIVDFLRSVSAQLVGCPFMMTLHTFRGRLQLSIDYFPNKITDEVAKDFFNTLVTYIEAIIDQKPLVNL